MKKKLIGYLLIMLPVAVFAQTLTKYDSVVQVYINEYKDIAIEEMNRTKVPASITLAQGILESDAGRSALATEANNHFGVKCHDNWTGETYHYDDDAPNECFRKYNSAIESYKDHSDFLVTRDRYAICFACKMTDYKSWAYSLKKAGYATNPKYAEMLIKSIEKYHLYQYDYPADIYLAKQDSIEKNISTPITMHNSKISADDLGARIVFVNNIRAVRLMPDETLTQLGRRFDIGLKRVLRYNDLVADQKLPAGTLLYLQPKHRTGDSLYYYIKNNESMYDIAQQNGVQLLSLYQRNKMPVGTEAATGEIIYLQGMRTSTVKLREKNDSIPPTQIIPAPINKTDSTSNMITAPDDYKYYTVKSGDTLFSIAKAYNLQVEKIKEMNKLYSDIISAGMRLKVAD